MNTGKNAAQTVSEIAEGLEQSKKQEVANTRGKSVYKVDSAEYQEAKLKALIHCTLEELTDTLESEKISLENTEEVKRRAVVYMRICEAVGVFPTNLGLARCLGYSNKALNFWRSKRPEHPTSEFLEMFADTCVDILSQSALKNNANAVFTMFYCKAHYGLRDNTEVIQAPNTEEKQIYDIDAIRSKYLPD